MFRRLLKFLWRVLGVGEDFFRRLISLLGEILDLPDIEDEAAVRAFVRKVLVALQWLAEWTPPEFDDKLILQAIAAVDDDAVWAEIYKVLVVILRGESTEVALTGNKGLCQAAARINIPWEMIVKVVKLIIEILVLIGVLRRRRGR